MKKKLIIKDIDKVPESPKNSLFVRFIKKRNIKFIKIIRTRIKLISFNKKNKNIFIEYKIEFPLTPSIILKALIKSIIQNDVKRTDKFLFRIYSSFKKLNFNESIAKFSFIKIETIKIINIKASLLFADKSYLSSNKPIKKTNIKEKNKEKISLVVFKKFKSSFANI
jgi:hypothetical protein